MGYATPRLVNGLRHLIKDVSAQRNIDAAAALADRNGGTTSLIQFSDKHVCYRDVNVRELCVEGSFESVMWLLLHGHVPDVDQRADVSAVLSESAVIDQPLADMIGTVPLQTRPLDLLPLSIQLLSCFDPTPSDRNLEASHSQFWRVMAQLPVLLHVAFGGKLQDGRVWEADNSDAGSFAGQLLQILRDDNHPPSPVEEHAMNCVLICECLTEMRAACYSARVFGGAVNDVVASLKSASSMFVAQLRNDPFEWVVDRLRDFKSPEAAETWLRSRDSQAMPFGFSDEAEDDRSRILRQQCRELLGSVNSMVVESSAARLELLQAHDDQQPTTDWTAARTLMLLNVPSDRISLAIGVARLVGWAAQTLEQHASGVSLVPTLDYAE